MSAPLGLRPTNPVRCTGLAVGLLAVAAAAQRQPAPDAEALRDAGVRAAQRLAVVLATPSNVDRLVQLEDHARAAGEAGDPALHLVLLRACRNAALARGDVDRAWQITESVLETFDLAAPAERLLLLDETRHSPGVTPETTMVVALRVAEHALRSGDLCSEQVDAALAIAAECLPAFADPAMAEWFRQRQLGLRQASTHREALAADDAAAAQRFRALYLDDWSPPLDAWRGSALPDADLATDPTPASPDGLDGLTRAARLLRAARRQTDHLPRRHLLVRAHQAAAGCWSQLADEHRERVLQMLDTIEDALSDDDPLGHVEFETPADQARMVFVDEGKHSEWWLADGALHGVNRWTRATATLRTAWSTVAAVSIRGRVVSRAGLNFRVALGELNVLYNWEQEPANVVWLGDDEHRVPGPWLEPGRLHDLRIRRLGGATVLFVDGREVYRADHEPSGALTVYPALGSVIAVDRIGVVGRPDLQREVKGPSGPAR